MLERIDRWMQLQEIAKMFGLSQESIKRLAKTHSLPLLRVTPNATPGALESELLHWLKSQPNVGAPIRTKVDRNKLSLREYPEKNADRVSLSRAD
jgi:hypothetical protein